MKLCTFQPLKVLRALEGGKTYRQKEDDLFDKIFTIPFDENARKRAFVLDLSMPQVLLYLDVPDECCRAIDNTTSINKSFFGSSKQLNCGYSDYLLSEIRPEWLTNYQIISESENPDSVQDAFFDTKFPELESVSGKRWLTASPDDIDTLLDKVGEFEYEQLMHSIMNYLQPVVPHDSHELERVLELVENAFTY